MYHAIDGNDRYAVTRLTFERHMLYLHRHRFHTVVPGETPRVDADERPVMITFDDGFRSDLTLALPIMERWGFRPVSFVTVDYVGRYGYLAWNDVRALSDAGGSIQSHTCSHALLPMLPTEMVRHELRESRVILEQVTGRQVKSLSLPGGGISGRVRRLVQEEGYRYLFTSRPSLGVCRVTGRVLVTETMTEKIFAALVAGDRCVYIRRAAAYDIKQVLRAAVGPERYLRLWRRYIKYRGAADAEAALQNKRK